MESILAILILIADVWAILNIFQSSVDTFKKALWIALVLVLPLLGVSSGTLQARGNDE